MTPTRRILLCADESDLEQLVAKHLGSRSFYVDVVRPSQIESFSNFLNEQPDLMILMNHSENSKTAIKIIEEIRLEKNPLAIIHLIRDDHFSARVQSLNAGSDDVLSPAFALEELDARIEALLRRSAMGSHHLDGSLIKHKGLVLNTDTREINRAQITERLTIKEYELLTFFLKNPNQAIPRKVILHNIWGQNWTGDDNLLEVYIRYLRKKIERPGHEKLIETVRGVGYMLR